MTGLIERTLGRLEGQLPGRVSRPGDNRYIAATALWARPIGRMPRAVAHCRTPQDVQLAILAARDAGLSLSVRGGGHDWAGRALCDGLVIDLSGMNDVLVEPDHLTARISGGARALDVLTVTDPRGLAAVTGSCGAGAHWPRGIHARMDPRYAPSCRSLLCSRVSKAQDGRSHRHRREDCGRPEALEEDLQLAG